MQQYEQYVGQYNDFINQNKIGNQFILQATSIEYSSKNFRILKYQADQTVTNRVILIVPSIFNSPEILFLGKTGGLVSKLQHLGTVYLIHWQSITDANYSLDDYVLELAYALDVLNNNTKQLINLIGHCIGGNLSIAAQIIKPELVKTLTLLTTPWDFTHFNANYQIQQYLNLDKNIQLLPVIPKIYTKILFFFLAPEYFNTKIVRYFDLDLEEDRQLFFKIEHWLMSGHDLPAATYFQITRELVTANIPAHNSWQINNNIIDPSTINIPVSLIIARTDKIAPMSSILTLLQNIKHSTIMEVEGGHISYLLKNAHGKFFQMYKSWFEEKQ
jgi:polyhydroxyalkanoate synthase